MRVSSFISHIEATAPLTYAASWDRSGIQVAGTLQDIRRIAVCLDPTLSSVETAIREDADFILCHHPITLSPRLPDRIDDYHHILRTVLGRGCWLYAAHTSLDAQPQGPVSWAARELGLKNTRVLEPTGAHELLSIQIPQKHDLPISELESMPSIHFLQEDGQGLRFAVWNDQWSTVRPFLEERKVDYMAFPTAAPRREYGFGWIGDLAAPLSGSEFHTRIVEQLQLPIRSQTGPLPERITRVACCPGSGADLAAKAFKAGADVYITGDLKYHQAQDAAGIILDVGHFSLEERMMALWESDLRRDLASRQVETFFIAGKDPLHP